ncbi:MAG: hypothetical protein H6Q64_2296, partial [Firmicutes bacterium]|nr:hypothetical protein [Bacillota bacterium]
MLPVGCIYVVVDLEIYAVSTFSSHINRREVIKKMLETVNKMWKAVLSSLAILLLTPAMAMAS